MSVLLLLKAMKVVGGLVRPIVGLLPEWLPVEKLLSFLLVLIVCFLVATRGARPATFRSTYVRRSLIRLCGSAISGNMFAF